MSTDTNKDEQTQPVRVQANQNPSEDTSQIILAQPKSEPAENIPGWLLEFASQPTEQPNGEHQHGLEAIEEPAPEPLEAVAPIVLETAEWHVVQAELEQPAVPLDKSKSPNLADQNIQELLELGDFTAAADLIRKTATTKELAQESQRALRSHLVLQEDRLELWTVYGELAEKIDQQHTQTESMEDEWKDR